MRGWLLANLFLLAVVLIAAGCLWSFVTLVQWLHVPPAAERSLTGLAAVLSLVVTYFLCKWLHRWLGKRLGYG